MTDITLGSKVHAVKVADLAVTETVHGSRVRLRPHDHEPANVNVVLSGEFSEIVETKTFECRAGSILLKPRGARHANAYSDSGARCVLIEIPDRFDERLITSQPRHLFSLRAAAVAAEVAREMASNAPGSDLMIEGLLYEILALLVRSDDDRGRTPSWLAAARDLIDESFATSLTLSEVAARIGRHPAHVARAFRREFGITVGEYVRRARVGYAARQLASTDESLSEIALAAGFVDQSHFTTAFRRAFGITPARYREQERNSGAMTPF